MLMRCQETPVATFVHLAEMNDLEHWVELTVKSSVQATSKPPLAPSEGEKAKPVKLGPQISDTRLESKVDIFVSCKQIILTALCLTNARTTALLATELRPLIFHTSKLQQFIGNKHDAQQHKYRDTRPTQVAAARAALFPPQALDASSVSA